MYWMWYVFLFFFKNIFGNTVFLWASRNLHLYIHCALFFLLSKSYQPQSIWTNFSKTLQPQKALECILLLLIFLLADRQKDRNGKIQIALLSALAKLQKKKKGCLRHVHSSVRSYCNRLLLRQWNMRHFSVGIFVWHLRRPKLYQINFLSIDEYTG
jgi:hypothetical protein